ncbi:MAG: hypothetical protein ACPHP7_01385 [Planctomycetota bacterium]
MPSRHRIDSLKSKSPVPDSSTMIPRRARAESLNIGRSGSALTASGALLKV